MRITGWAVLAALWLAGTPAAAYGPRGHEVIGAIADARLTAHAKQEIAAAIGMPLATAATWADCVKDVVHHADGSFRYEPDPRYHAACKAFETKAGQARMVDYVKRNWNRCTDAWAHQHGNCHKLYHFADVPIQQKRYAPTAAGAAEHDVVHAIGAAIAFLQGRPVPAPFSIRDRAEAVLLLAHLVGDVHQPLHVGSIYLKGNLPVNPGTNAKPLDRTTFTVGGNALEDGSGNLHAGWDNVPTRLDPVRPGAELIAAAQAVPASAGDPDGWAAAWASETLVAAGAAFKDLRFTHDGAAKPGEWVVVFKDRPSYLKARSASQAREIPRAGARLAEIFNTVWP